MKFNANPAFSFGSGKWSTQLNNFPGPGTYKQQFNTITTNKIGYAKTHQNWFFKEQLFQDPGNYNNLKKSNIRGSYFSTKYKKALNWADVGPGQYNVQQQHFNKKLAIQGKSKRFQSVDYRAPGPGHYGDSLQKQYKSVINSKQQRFQQKYDQIGPGQYDIDNKGIIRKTKFGQQPRFSQKQLDSRNYDVNKGKYGQKLGKFGQNSRFQQKMDNQMDYQDINKFWQQENRSKQYGKFGRDWKLDLKVQNREIGPGKYEISQKQKFKNIINQTQKVKRISKNSNPGPIYDINIKKQSKLGKIGKDWKLVSNDNGIPGVGRYDINLKKSRKLLPKLKQRYSKKYSENPGPGKYKNVFKKNILQGKFTTSSFYLPKNENPGPGQYDIKPTIPDVPKYLL